MTAAAPITKFDQLLDRAYQQGRESVTSGEPCNYGDPDFIAAWHKGRYDAQQIVDAGVPAADGIYAGIPDSLYHSDRDSLSSTGAKTILEPGGPAKLRHARRKESTAFDLGHAVHTAVLGEGAVFEDSGFDTWTTKAAKEKVAEIREAGRIPLKPDQYRDVTNMADAVRTHPMCKVLFAKGVAEQSIWAHDEQTGTRIRCRPDWHVGPMFVDMKTTTDAGRFDKAIEDFAYHLSSAFYLHTAKAAGIQVDSFILVAVSKDYPHLVDVCEISPHDLAIGHDLVRAAIDLWAHCHTNDLWPGLPPVLRTTKLPDRIRYRADEAINRAHATITEGTTPA